MSEQKKEPGVITEQLELMELYLINATRIIREEQTRSLLKPCRARKIQGCAWCRIKRYILRKRYK